VSTQGLTYPHDFDLSQKQTRLLRCIKRDFGGACKSLISLRSRRCRESGQDVCEQAAASVSACPGGVLHKVTHRSGGESQKEIQIMNLQLLFEAFCRAHPTQENEQSA
jgi:hypothetical protein